MVAGGWDAVGAAATSPYPALAVIVPAQSAGTKSLMRRVTPARILLFLNVGRKWDVNEIRLWSCSFQPFRSISGDRHDSAQNLQLELCLLPDRVSISPNSMR